MKPEFKFAVFDDKRRTKSSTAYRVMKRSNIYVIERCNKSAKEWDNAFDRSVRFNTLDDVFNSAQFKSIFTEKKK